MVDLAAGAVVATIDVPGKPAGVALGPDGRVHVTSPEAPGLTTHDPATGGARRLTLGAGPLGVATNPADGSVYVADWYEDRLYVVRDGAVVAEIPTGKSPSGVAVTPDGRRILSADRDSDQVSIFDAGDFRPLAVVPTGGRPFGVTVDADGRLAYTADVATDTVTVIDVAAGAQVAQIAVGARPYAVALANGRGFVTNSYGDSVTVFDLATRTVVAEVAVGEYPEGVDVSADGQLVYVANWGSDTLSVIDAETLTVTAEIAVGEGPRAFGRFVAD
ncbi:MAG: YncE family protein [Rubrimonas sp.]